MSSLHVLDDPGAVAGAAATAFLVAAAEAIERRGVFRVALSGGTTPARLYDELERRLREGAYRPDWDRVDVFWGDERLVPHGDGESNFGNARDALVEGLGVPEGALHPVPTELGEPEVVARAYEAAIVHATGTPRGVTPRFDLVLLGMGPDGHTASLFPGSAALEEEQRLVVETEVKMPTPWRVTMTYPLLDAARRVAFMVTGSDKAAALRQVLEHRAGEDLLPAARVRPKSAPPLWLVDRAAAGQLSAPSSG